MPLRLLVSIAILIAAFLVLFVVLIATEAAVTVWHYLREAPPWVQLGYAVLLAGLATGDGGAVLELVSPARRKRAAVERARSPRKPCRTRWCSQPPAASTCPPRWRKSANSAGAAAPGSSYRRLREVSSGKSSLVNALVPEARIATDPRAGTTTSIRHYAWQAPSGDRITITDLPGFNLEDDRAAVEETRRAHLVIFLCDADLTNSQARQLRFLQDLGKPLVLALNKADRYSPAERESVLAELRKKTGMDEADVVAVSTGGRERSCACWARASTARRARTPTRDLRLA